MTTTTDQLVNVGEAARVLGLTPRALYALEHKNVLSPVRFGPRGHRRFRLSDLEKIIRGSAMPAPKPRTLH